MMIINPTKGKIVQSKKNRVCNLEKKIETENLLWLVRNKNKDPWLVEGTAERGGDGANNRVLYAFLQYTDYG